MRSEHYVLYLYNFGKLHSDTHNVQFSLGMRDAVWCFDIMLSQLMYFPGDSDVKVELSRHLQNYPSHVTSNKAKREALSLTPQISNNKT